MGTSFTGLRIKDTYKSLIKVTDNSEVDASGKQLSDGDGNDFGVYVDTDGTLGLGGVASYAFDAGAKTGAIRIPKGTTVQRNNLTATAGLFRYNTSTSKYEIHDTGWKNLFTESGGTIDGNVTITGDLTVEGTNLTINVSTLEVEDPVINLNRTQGSPDTATAGISGISVFRGSGISEASFLFNETLDTWELTNNLNVTGSGTQLNTNILYVQSDGSAASPTLAFTDSGTGFYQPATNVIAISNNGTETARFTADRRLGIGTTSPSFPLHVYHATTDTIARLESGDATVALSLKASDNTAVLQTSGTDFLVKNDGAGNLRFWNNGSERMRIDSSGSLGINITNPNSYSFNGDANIVAGNTSGNGTISVVSSTTGLGYLAFADATSGIGRYSGVIEYGHTDNYMSFKTASTERMRIDSSGNVGINTTSPSRKFSIYDTSAIPMRVETNTSDNKIEIITSSGTQFVQGSANNLLFGTNNIERIRIDSSGNVGIGTGSPTETLEVAGDVLIKDGSNDVNIYLGNDNYGFGIDYSTGDISIKTNNATRIAVLNGGNVGIGTTSPTGLLTVEGVTSSNTVDIKGGSEGASRAIRLLDGGTATKYNWLVGAQYNINNAFEITPSTAVGGTTFSSANFVVLQNGDIGTGADTDVIYDASSDKRVKKKIKTISGGLDSVMKLNPVTFEWKKDHKPEKEGDTIYGFIAQELQEVIPEAVYNTGNSSTINGQEVEDILNIKKEYILPVLVKAIQEQQKEIEYLKSKIK